MKLHEEKTAFDTIIQRVADRTNILRTKHPLMAHLLTKK